MLISIISLSKSQTPTGTANSTITPWNPSNSSYAWFRGGNLPGGAGGNNNIFGTFWNSPIYTFTDSQGRTRLNGTQNATVNGVTKNFDGYYGISPFGYFNSNTPKTMLHLSGKNNALGFGTGGGWRLWMETGLLMNENSDGMYVGLKQEGTNRSDAIINWSDDPTGSAGPDKLRFIHTGANLGNGNNQTDQRDPFALNGYEYMRMTAQGPNNALGYASGHIGIGPMFTQINFPQSRVHMHSEDNLNTFLQISNNTSTGIGAADGIRLGILGDQNSINEEGNALLYNQEKKHLLFSTAHATPSDINNSNERMRITSWETETSLPNGSYGTYIPDPNNLPTSTDITRVSISHNPAFPVTRPLSLLHLGYNTGGSSLTPGATDGWRSWMNIGIFTTNSTDNVYIGLKREPATPLNPTDRNDAVVSWGDNQAPGFPMAGPDNMRFIFTATQTGSPTTAPANTFDGLESMRMTPTLNSGVFTGIGGDPNANNYFGGSLNPTNTLEINSWGNVNTPGGSSGLRFTELNTSTPTIANPGSGVLAVDANGDVIYVNASSGSPAFGNICGQTQSPIPNNIEIPLNNFNFVFTGQGSTSNNVGIGTNCAPTAKLEVRRTNVSSSNSQTVGILVENSDNAVNNCMGIQTRVTGASQDSYGHYAGATGAVNTNFGGYFETFGNADYNTGVKGSASSGNIINAAFDASANGTGNSSNYGYRSYTYGTTTGFNFGIQSQVTGGNINYGAWEQVYGSATANFGIYTNVSGASSNYGIFSVVPTTNPDSILGPDYAGFFAGDLAYTGDFGFASDINLKQNINDITNANNIISQLSPKTFEFQSANYSFMNLSEGNQFGLIAQDVETILPELVNENVFPALYDTNGIQTSPAVTYKTIDYVKLIPILIQGSKEQIHAIDSLENIVEVQDSINTALQDQINTLYGMITTCCNNNSNMSQNNSMQQNQNGNSLDVTLTDNIPSIVLDQNVPNPFAEQTTITYTLTDGVQKAQMLFYNIEGKLIQSVDLSNTAGQGQINVFANDLSTGVYTYSLVVNGQIKGTKRMVKQ